MHNLSTEERLMGLRRFIASRGKPDDIISDNAMQFKLASETVNIIWQRVLKCPDVQNYASETGISWKFIVELAPWMGGFYERLVGLVKRSLSRNQTNDEIKIICVPNHKDASDKFSLDSAQQFWWRCSLKIVDDSRRTTHDTRRTTTDDGHCTIPKAHSGTMCQVS